MWRVQRLYQINAQIPANLFDSRLLTLENEAEQIGRYLIVRKDLRPIWLGGYRDRNHISECYGVQSRDLRSFSGHMMAEVCRRPRIFIWTPLTWDTVVSSHRQ